jgi:hypothetical protein
MPESYGQNTDMFYSVDASKSFPPGVTPLTTRAADKPRRGDFYLTHQKDTGFPPAFALIRWGQKLLYRGDKAKYTFWNHAGIFVDDDGTVVEALNDGVVRRGISAYRQEEYTVVYLEMLESDRDQVVAYANSRVGDKYGWLVIANIAFRLLSGGRLGYHIEGQDICSALVAQSLRAAGYNFKGFDPNRIMPADLAYLAGVEVPS